MGTNYYLKKRGSDELIHVGKMVSKKERQEFIWAMNPFELFEMHKKTPGFLIVNEYGPICGVFSFMAMINDVEENMEHIGEKFC